MKTGTLFFMFFFLNIGFTLVDMVELSDGVYLKTSASFENPLNEYVSETQIAAGGLQDVIALFEGDFISLNPVKVTIGGTAFGFELKADVELPAIIAKPINSFGGLIDWIVNIGLVMGKLLANTFITPVIFIPSLFNAFFPTPIATTTGVLLGTAIVVVLIYDLITLITPAGTTEHMDEEK